MGITVLAALACAGIAGCGAAPILPTGLTTTMAGNWNLVGTGLFSYPAISLAIFVNGNQITAIGSQSISCSTFGVGASTFLSGTVAADGSFVMTGLGGTINGSAIQVTVQGTFPAVGATTWNGTYTIAVTPAVGCLSTQSAPFTAQLIGPLNGTYSGTLSSGSAVFGSNPTITSAAVDLAVTQGLASSNSTRNGTIIDYYLPLAGTIDVTGSPCY